VHEGSQRIQAHIAAGRAVAHANDSVGAQASLAAHQRVRGQAIITLGILADRKFDHLDFFCAQAAFPQRAIQIQRGFQRHRAVGADADIGVRHFADRAFDGGEQLGSLAGGFRDRLGEQTGHDVFPFKVGWYGKQSMP